MSVERRQVVELMPARLRVVEHRAEVVRCSSCGRRTKASFPAGVTATVQYGPSILARALYLHDYQLLPYARAAEAMRELFGCAISAGTLSTAVRRCAAGLIETEVKIKRGLRRSPIIHADETGLRVKGKLAYVHVASNARLTHYAADVRRGKEPSMRSTSCLLTAAPASTTGGSLTRTTRAAATPCAACTC
jgi:transposase